MKIKRTQAEEILDGLNQLFWDRDPITGRLITFSDEALTSGGKAIDMLEEILER